MDCCEEGVIIGCGLYLLAEEEKRKNESYLLLNCYGNLYAVNYTNTPVLVPK
jgi:hypothetical protein